MVVLRWEGVEVVKVASKTHPGLLNTFYVSLRPVKIAQLKTCLTQAETKPLFFAKAKVDIDLLFEAPTRPYHTF
jgi:hypothetical protein